MELGGSKLVRGQLPERSVRSRAVVVKAPSFDNLPSFGECGEDVIVEAFVAKLAVKALYECILRRLAWRDVMQLYTSPRRPCKHRKTRQFRAIVHHQSLRIRPAFSRDAIENASYTRSAYRCVHLDCKRFPGEVVDDVERP